MGMGKSTDSDEWIVSENLNPSESNFASLKFSVDGFQARFPGLYALYEETPERRRINGIFKKIINFKCRPPLGKWLCSH